MKVAVSVWTLTNVNVTKIIALHNHNVSIPKVPSNAIAFHPVSLQMMVKHVDNVDKITYEIAIRTPYVCPVIAFAMMDTEEMAKDVKTLMSALAQRRVTNYLTTI